MGRVLTGFLIGAALAPQGIARSPAFDLTFERRLEAQAAIERVYYSHQIGVTLPFDQAVTREILEKKVRNYLKQSVALDRYWHTPVSGEMLRAEAQRIARGTRMPERLSELYAALGDDPLLIQECLVRPVLVDRLARAFFSGDQRFHDAERRQADNLREELAASRLDYRAQHPSRRVDDFTLAPHDDTRGTHGLAPAEFSRLRDRLPLDVGEVGPVVEGTDSYTVSALLESGEARLRVATWTIPKIGWDEWWPQVEGELDERDVRAFPDVVSTASLSSVDPESATGTCKEFVWNNGILDDPLIPTGLSGHAAVWTGSLMIVWNSPSRIGYRYDPATDTWMPVSTTGAPSARPGSSTVWAGGLMIVWGGGPIGGPFYLSDGARYDPVNDSWTQVSASGAPAPRGGHTAIWTGQQMVISGGVGTKFVGPHRVETTALAGGVYDPVMNSWGSGPGFNRRGHTAVWTGTQMILWGGTCVTDPVYDPLGCNGNDVRRGLVVSFPGGASHNTSIVGAPTTVGGPAVWASGFMMIWGGSGRTGARYDPAADMWSLMATANSPPGYTQFNAISTGSRMVIWGGSNGSSAEGTGGQYDPNSDVWSSTSIVNAPSPRTGHSAIWTGGRMIVWGGPDNSGGRYDPVADSWTPTSRGASPAPRYSHVAVWTGSQMIVWGGTVTGESYRSGGRYDPALDAWSRMSAINAPTQVGNYVAVWAGGRFVIWGGYGYAPDIVYGFNTGGRYDPVSDSWEATSTAGAPSARQGPIAVSTGPQMILWGGQFTDCNPGPACTTTYYQDGGRYDPVSDTWAEVTSAGAPSARSQESAIWTGNGMIVWGGSGFGSGAYEGLNTGGIYDPFANAWTPTATAGAPPPRMGHKAVWTGSEMIILGGTTTTPPPCGCFTTDYYTSGARYDPAAHTWSSMASFDARYGYSTVWADGEMIVWGGTIAPSLTNTGGRYDPASDMWTATSTLNAPSGRTGHGAVWTGDSMLVWGGQINFVALGDGGRYTPAAVQPNDADADGFPAACDCDNNNASMWWTPGEAGSLSFLDAGSMTWQAPAEPGGTTEWYDVLRAVSSSDFLANTSCVATDTTLTTLVDSSVPSAGGVFYYFVRARNLCPAGQNQGPLGFSSNGALRTGRSCP